MFEKKKLFPKLKKQISNFLTDESGEITKKDALGIAAGSVFLSSAQVAESHWSGQVHSNAWSGWLPTVKPWDAVFLNPQCSHMSWVVNGHLSWTPEVNQDTKIVNHANSSKHGSHSSGGWC